MMCHKSRNLNASGAREGLILIVLLKSTIYMLSAFLLVSCGSQDTKPSTHEDSQQDVELIEPLTEPLDSTRAKYYIEVFNFTPNVEAILSDNFDNITEMLDSLGPNGRRKSELQLGVHLYLGESHESEDTKYKCTGYFGTLYISEKPKIWPIEFGVIRYALPNGETYLILTSDFGHGCNNFLSENKNGTEFHLDSFSQVRIEEMTVTISKTKEIDFLIIPRRRP